MFTVHESTTDYYVTLVEYFQINIRSVTDQVFQITQGAFKFEIKIYSNGIKAKYKGFICVSIRMLTIQQGSIDLQVTFSIRASDGDEIWQKHIHEELISVNDIQIFKLISLDTVIKEANKILDNGGFFTIRMAGFYLNRRQHAITKSDLKFNDKIHTNVKMSFVWTLCNLTLPMVNGTYSIESSTLFGGLNVAEFYLQVLPGTNYSGFVSILITLLKAPIHIKLPIRVKHTFELINSSSPEHCAIVQYSSVNQYESELSSFGYQKLSNYEDFVTLVRQQCAAFIYYIEYYTKP